MRNVVSYGGGVNGVAMVIAMMRMGIKPDAVLFADTGAERAMTYKHIKYFSDWLVSQGWPPITTVTYTTKSHRRLTLEQEILRGKKLPSIAYGFKRCSQKHKIWPQHRWVKHHFGKESIIWYVGFDAGESRRIKTNPVKHHRNVYPLIELGWDRSRCVEEIQNAGILVPCKSSCFFCPSMKKHEILALSPEEKEKAMAIEANAKPNLDSLKGLGRRFSWTDLIIGDEEVAAAAIREEKIAESFKLLTGEDYEPVPCECIN